MKSRVTRIPRAYFRSMSWQCSTSHPRFHAQNHGVDRYQPFSPHESTQHIDIIYCPLTRGVCACGTTYSVLREHFDAADADMPPIGLTEYNAVFRQTPACGGSQQFISFLWQTAFIGQTVERPDYGLLNHFSARAIPVKCTGKSDFEGYQVHGVSKRAPKDSYSIVSAALPEWGVTSKPQPAYYAFWLWNRYGGDRVIHTYQTATLKLFVTRFDATGDVGVIVVNSASAAAGSGGDRRDDDDNIVGDVGADATVLLQSDWFAGMPGTGEIAMNLHVFSAAMGTGGYPGAEEIDETNPNYMTEV